MFCDLVESTKLSEKFDPEDYRHILKTYQNVASRCIEEFNGFIAQHLGDGLLVYFGYPVSFEDNATRALIAGLRIIEEISKLIIRVNDQEIHIQVKIGVHTGNVLLDQIKSTDKTEYLALGETPNLASRIKDFASNNQLIISSVTYNLVSHIFDCEYCGKQPFKGISREIEIFRVLNKRSDTSKNSYKPLVGRVQELELIIDRWEQVKEGNGQVAIIIGDAGIGKTRLIEDVKYQTADEQIILMECFCSPYYQNSFLYPLMDYFKKFLFSIEPRSINNAQRTSDIISELGLSEEFTETFT